MSPIDPELLKLDEPRDYFLGVGTEQFPIPTNILMFIRPSREKLQQQAVQNRSHHRFVLIFNLKTKGNVHIDHLELPLCPGQAILIHPYQFHHFSHLAAPTLQWLICTFEISSSSFLDPLRNQCLNLLPPTHALLTRLLETWQPPRPADMLQVALLQLLVSLRSQHLSPTPTLPGGIQGSLLQQINHFLTHTVGKPVVCGDLARSLGLSESRLRATFKTQAGVPLGQYIQNYRLNRAMSLLRTTTRTIGDIAEEVGFGSPQAFCRLFKKEIGLTPRTYRMKRD